MRKAIIVLAIDTLLIIVVPLIVSVFYGHKIKGMVLDNNATVGDLVEASTDRSFTLSIIAILICLLTYFILRRSDIRKIVLFLICLYPLGISFLLMKLLRQ